jgi:SAM-dependent methyltransferase
MKELSKSIQRRLREPNFISRYFRGVGIDIGGLPDPFFQYKELFPLVTEVKTWDLVDGDAQFMAGEADESYDFVLSSHCLEHLHDPFVGILNWFRLLRPGGHLVVTIPDEDLYEQGIWPSRYNRDHKHTFSIWKDKSWSPVSINVIDLVRNLGSQAEIKLLKLEDTSYRYHLPTFDQTLTPVAESSIEFVIRKRTLREVDSGYTRTASRPLEHSQDINPYLNQLVADKKALKNLSSSNPPFQDRSNPEG